ncbi:M20/M25/M40 family metallo-hydrolase [Chitinophaga sp. Cy-1792]|uniref:M20/M25/M40 family metallo-hydrolase n=1 Tax=Chitinophaga sp. Cy-1792 TaxID=2608339 RepID=UPI0014213F9E|nr:M20/M25/M40 family metallo-hydrolase [Chitinophaga sp. Cy-1792]NIG55133.1 M20/M25/M40 family metallo-hydrolase [Chitinophaga sp. Cy-1792]
MKKLLLLILVAVVVLAVVILVKTLTYPFAPVKTAGGPPKTYEISDSALLRFSGGIRIPTVSNVDYSQFNYAPFDTLDQYLVRMYPLVYAHMEHYKINQHALVFHWKGKNPSLKPVIYLAHQDVVPPGDPSGKDSGAVIFSPKDKPLPPITAIAQTWDYYPFSGNVVNGRIYGRGTLDMKPMLFSLMEAASNLLEKSFTPERDIYFAFGFDEEVGGTEGAKKIAADFQQKNIRFDAVYDEGGIVSTKGSLAGINTSVALIGCAEKGFWSIRIKVKGLGGHSSMPPLQSAIGKAAVIMQRLENDQMKPMIIPTIDEFFKQIGGSMGFTSRMAIANQWLFKGMLIKQLTANHTTNALVRTTTALTQMKGSDASNVLAPVVDFVVNFRLLPGNTEEDVRKHVLAACSGFDVELENVREVREASRVSSINSQGYKVMERTIQQYFPDAVVAPYLTIGGTDAYKYEIVSDHVYRFLPVAINNFEQQTIHNNNEYISIENYSRMIRYFETLMSEYDKQ